jgi:hypothetical protein
MFLVLFIDFAFTDANLSLIGLDLSLYLKFIYINNVYYLPKDLLEFLSPLFIKLLKEHQEKLTNSRRV